MSVLLVALGAAIGAPLRYLTDRAVQSQRDTLFPLGTFTVNAVGSLLLGALAASVAAGAPTWLLTAAGTGFCGALTTFSTFAYETTRLVQDGALDVALANVAISLAVGLGACAGGWALVTALT